MDDVVVSDSDRALIARRLRRWPAEWRESHFASLPRDERKIVALLVLDLDARPELAELLPEPVEPQPVQTSMLDAPERPEPTWPEWSKHRPGKPRELPAEVEAFMREHGIRR